MKTLLAALAAFLIFGTAGVSHAQEINFVFGPDQYCWYDNGWDGPGWYVCGDEFVYGLGWGGPDGWYGHRHGGFHHDFFNHHGRGTSVVIHDRGDRGDRGHGHR